MFFYTNAYYSRDNGYIDNVKLFKVKVKSYLDKIIYDYILKIYKSFEFTPKPHSFQSVPQKSCFNPFLLQTVHTYIGLPDVSMPDATILCIAFCVIVGVGVISLVYMHVSPDLNSLFNDLDTAHSTWYVTGNYRDWGFEPAYACFLRLVDSVKYTNYAPDRLIEIKKEFFFHVDIFNKLKYIRNVENLELNSNIWNIVRQIQTIDPNFNLTDYTLEMFPGMMLIDRAVELNAYELMLEIMPYLTT